MYYKLHSFYDTNDYRRTSKSFIFIWTLNLFFVLELFTILKKYPNVFSFVFSFSFAIILLYVLQNQKKYLVLLQDAERNDTKVCSVIFWCHIFLTVAAQFTYMYFKYKSFVKV